MLNQKNFEGERGMNFYKAIMLGLFLSIGTSSIICMEETEREAVQEMSNQGLANSKKNLEKTGRKTEREELQLRLVNEELEKRNPVNWSNEKIDAELNYLLDEYVDAEEAGTLTPELEEELKIKQTALIAEQERRKKGALSRPSSTTKRKAATKAVT